MYTQRRLKLSYFLTLYPTLILIDITSSIFKEKVRNDNGISNIKCGILEYGTPIVVNFPVEVMLNGIYFFFVYQKTCGKSIKHLFGFQGSPAYQSYWHSKWLFYGP